MWAALRLWSLSVDEAKFVVVLHLEPWNDIRLDLDVGSPELLGIVGLGMGVFPRNQNWGSKLDNTWGSEKGCL